MKSLVSASHRSSLSSGGTPAARAAASRSTRLQRSSADLSGILPTLIDRRLPSWPTNWMVFRPSAEVEMLAIQGVPSENTGAAGPVLRTDATARRERMKESTPAGCAKGRSAVPYLSECHGLAVEVLSVGDPARARKIL
jgi:hypothetical protein